MFCMGNKNNVKPNEIFSLYFDHDDVDDIGEEELTEDDRLQMQEQINAINAELEKKRAQAQENNTH